MSRNNRRLKNFLLVPQAQVRFGILFMACSSAIHIAMTVAALTFYMNWISAEQEGGDQLSAGLVLLAVVVIFVILQAFAFILALVISHRLFGPLVPLSRFVEQIKRGDYSSRIHLRESDEEKIREFAKSLNEMAEILEKNAAPR